jgi:predicted unusual protein kinase regulating ubiquinone biosynthesis (AarF/ABC1/UbiB family)
MIESKPLAPGTVGQVHRAILKHSGQKVAVKILRPNLLPQVEREFSVFERKSNPNIFRHYQPLKRGYSQS